MPILASLGAGSIGSFRTSRNRVNLDTEPRLILALSNSGTFAYKFYLSNNTISNVTTTYITTASPQSAGSYERIRASDTTNVVAVTGWTTPIRAAAFDTTTTPFTQYNKSTLPIGSSGNALGGESAASSLDDYVYFTSFTAGGAFPLASDSYTAIPNFNNYDPICYRHNRLYHWDGTTGTVRVYPYGSTTAIFTTGNSPFGSGNTNITSIKASAINPPSSNSALNFPEIVTFSSGAATFVVKAEANNTFSNVATYSYGSGYDAQAVTRDGSIICIAQSTSPYTIRFYSAPNYDTPISSFNPPDAIRSLDVFKQGRIIAALSINTLYIYDINGNLLDSEPTGTYGVAVLY